MPKEDLDRLDQRAANLDAQIAKLNQQLNEEKERYSRDRRALLELGLQIDILRRNEESAAQRRKELADLDRQEQDSKVNSHNPDHDHQRIA